MYFFLSLMFVGVFMPGWARAGVAVKNLIFGEVGPGPDWFWTALVFVIALLIIFGPRQIYATVERSITGMVLVITIGMLIVAFSVGTLTDVGAMLGGIVNFGHIELDDEFTFHRFFGAFVFAGAGGLGNLYYAYYLRDKGIGMGARIPALLNPLREYQTASSEIGYVFPDNEQNAARFRSWFSYVKVDSVGSSGSATRSRCSCSCSAHSSCCIRRESFRRRVDCCGDLALILEGPMGPFGRYLFLIIGIAPCSAASLPAWMAESACGSICCTRTSSGCARLPQTRFTSPSRSAAGDRRDRNVVLRDVRDHGARFLLHQRDARRIRNGGLRAGFALHEHEVSAAKRPTGAGQHHHDVAGVTDHISFALYTLWTKVGAWFG